MLGKGEGWVVGGCGGRRVGQVEAGRKSERAVKGDGSQGRGGWVFEKGEGVG